MAKTKTITSLRNKLWKLTSLYVRLRGSDFDDNCSCVTCGHTRHYKEMQAGHFIAKAQGNAIVQISDFCSCARCINSPTIYPALMNVIPMNKNNLKII